MARLSFRCDAEMVGRVDRARRTPMGSVAREAWLRDAVELALRHAEMAQEMAEDPTGQHARRAAEPTRDQIYWHPDSPEERLLLGRNADSSQSKRDVRPIPKGGK